MALFEETNFSSDNIIINNNSNSQEIDNTYTPFADGIIMSTQGVYVSSKSQLSKTKYSCEYCGASIHASCKAHDIYCPLYCGNKPKPPVIPITFGSSEIIFIMCLSLLYIKIKNYKKRKLWKI